jgi:hypothetical protein
VSKKFRRVNPNLGDTPRIGPFPANQVIPWAGICFVSYYLCNIFTQLGWVWTFGLAGWGVTTWWILTGDKPWIFLSKFTKLPTWTRGYGKYQSLLDVAKPNDQKRKKTERKNRFSKG